MARSNKPPMEVLAKLRKTAAKAKAQANAKAARPAAAAPKAPAPSVPATPAAPAVTSKAAPAATAGSRGAGSSAAPAPSGAFAWQGSSAPASVSQSFTEKYLDMSRREIRDRASLLRRLGYSRDETLGRCRSYQDWEHEPFHSSQLLTEVAQIVDEVYQTRTGRSSTLSPE